MAPLIAEIETMCVLPSQYYPRRNNGQFDASIGTSPILTSEGQLRIAPARLR
jgi:hypothetical protein